MQVHGGFILTNPREKANPFRGADFTLGKRYNRNIMEPLKKRPENPSEAAAAPESDFPSQASLAADQEGCCSPATCEG
jgi:hypothetical protein